MQRNLRHFNSLSSDTRQQVSSFLTSREKSALSSCSKFSFGNTITEHDWFKSVVAENSDSYHLGLLVRIRNPLSPARQITLTQLDKLIFTRSLNEKLRHLLCLYRLKILIAANNTEEQLTTLRWLSTCAPSQSVLHDLVIAQENHDLKNLPIFWHCRADSQLTLFELMHLMNDWALQTLAPVITTALKSENLPLPHLLIMLELFKTHLTTEDFEQIRENNKTNILNNTFTNLYSYDCKIAIADAFIPEEVLETDMVGLSQLLTSLLPQDFFNYLPKYFAMLSASLLSFRETLIPSDNAIDIPNYLHQSFMQLIQYLQHHLASQHVRELELITSWITVQMISIISLAKINPNCVNTVSRETLLLSGLCVSTHKITGESFIPVFISMIETVPQYLQHPLLLASKGALLSILSDNNAYFQQTIKTLLDQPFTDELKILLGLAFHKLTDDQRLTIVGKALNDCDLLNLYDAFSPEQHKILWATRLKTVTAGSGFLLAITSKNIKLFLAESLQGQALDDFIDCFLRGDKSLFLDQQLFKIDNLLSVFSQAGGEQITKHYDYLIDFITKTTLTTINYQQRVKFQNALALLLIVSRVYGNLFSKPDTFSEAVDLLLPLLDSDRLDFSIAGSIPNIIAYNLLNTSQSLSETQMHRLLTVAFQHHTTTNIFEHFAQRIEEPARICLLTTLVNSDFCNQHYLTLHGLDDAKKRSFLMNNWFGLVSKETLALIPAIHTTAELGEIETMTIHNEDGSKEVLRCRF
jgi:hypothetical protein